MKNGNTFNSAPDTSRSFEDAYGSWDTLQEELAQQKLAKAEAEATKKREEELAKGAKKFDKSVRDAIHKGDKVAFDEIMERDEHYRQMETGENRVEDEPYESSILSQEEFAQAVKSSDEIQKMDLLVRRMQSATSEEAKAKFQQELIQLSNEFSKGEGAIAVKDWHDQAQWDFQKASEAEGFRQKVLDTIWENAMAEPEAKQSNPDDGVKNEALNNGDNAEKQKPEVIEQNEHEKKFDEMLVNGATADELASKDTETNPEEKVERWQKLKKKIGRVIMGVLSFAGISAAAYGVGYNNGKTADSVNTNNSGSEVENKIKTEYSGASANEFSKYASFDSNNTQEQEKNFNNGKYDSENDDYNKIDQKENKYSIGTDTSKLSNEEYQKKMIESHNEDDIEYMGQFFINDAESAQNLLGISNNEVDALVDAARDGDQTAFKKLNDAYSKYMEGAKVVGNQTLDGDYYSLFINTNKDYAHAEGAFGGTARVVELKNGQQILIRDQCKQMVMKKIAEVTNTWTTPVIPFEETYTPPAPDTEEPPAPTPEAPPTSETPTQKLEAKDPTKDINVNPKLNPDARVDGQKIEVNTNEGNQQDEIQEVPNIYEAPAAQPNLNIQPSVGLANETVVGQGDVEVAPQYRTDGWVNDTTSQTWESAHNNGGTQVKAQEGTNGSAGVNTGRVE